MTWFNGQVGCVVPDHPLAAAASSVVGGMYVKRSTGAQRFGRLLGVAENPCV